MSMNYCKKPTVNGLKYCDECTRNAVEKNKELQNKMEVSKYSEDHLRMCKTLPEAGKCNYRMARGVHKGWYCANVCEKDEDYCEKCKGRVVEAFYHSTEDQTTQAQCHDEGLCQREIHTIVN